MADPTALWQEAFDEASQLTYYYNVETGETSWTLPQTEDQYEDLSYMAFAVVRLQSLFRGQRDRRQVVRLLRSTYQTTVDPVTQQTLYTHRPTGTSSWSPPALFTRLGIDQYEDLDDAVDAADDDDDVDFDAFQRDAEQDLEAANQGPIDESEGEEDGDDGDDGGVRSRKKKRKYPRSRAQERVDEAEDADTTWALDMSSMNAWRLSTRIWNLTALRQLSLANNLLQRIPSGIQDLIHLEHLDLSHNQLTRLPSCLQTTTTLTYLDASHNRIASFSPKLWKLRALTELRLAWNALHEMPYVEGDLKLLRDTREWQVGVGLLTSLAVLDLSHNRLAATPRSIEKCTALQTLDLSFNKLREIGDEVGELASLTSLQLSHNAIVELPESIGSLSQLVALRVDTNKIAMLPESIGNLHQLTDLDLRHNQLQHLPDEFAALGQVQRVALDHNPSLAVLATCLRFLPSIQTFSASHCGLVAVDSIEVLGKAPVQQLLLCDNALMDFPLSLTQSAMRLTLLVLSLARNSLTSFPSELVSCVRLQTLDLSYNRLQSIPSDIVKMTALQHLELSHNTLKSLPDAMMRLPRLSKLHCSHNALIALPLGVGFLSKLAHLDVAFNLLTTLPSSLVELRRSLRSLQANDNQFGTKPPAAALLSPDCVVDLSNNSFCEAENQADPTHAMIAHAFKCFNEQQYEKAEALASSTIELLNIRDQEALMNHWGRQQERLPTVLLLRALARFMQVQQAQRAIDAVSEVIDSKEKELHVHQLLRKWAAYRQNQSKTTLPSSPKRPTSNQDDGQPRPETDGQPVTTKATTTISSSNQEEEENDELHEAIERCTEARTLAARATQGALQDLERAISLGVAELPTALHVQGRLFMTTLAFAEAIQSFTKALRLIDVQAIRLLRAEAYRRLGQLPSALADVEHVLEKHTTDSAVEATLATLSREWTTQQTQYFVDHESLFRAFDVDERSGLPRRPEVHDAHAILTPAQCKQKTKLTPTQRFDTAVDALKLATAQAQQATRQRIQESYTERLQLLKRARDFKREIRENLAMEVEETTQRAVEQELQRLAELKRQELDREFNERMYMQYEDELMQWLVGEEKRLEVERLEREEAARRKAEAKAQYETRLARRGGRRQQLAARKTSVTQPRAASPSKGKKSERIGSHQQQYTSRLLRLLGLQCIMKTPLKPPLPEEVVQSTLSDWHDLAPEHIDMYISSGIASTFIQLERSGFECMEADPLLLICPDPTDHEHSLAFLHGGNYARPTGAPGHRPWPTGTPPAPRSRMVDLPAGVDAAPPFAFGHFIMKRCPQVKDKTNGTSLNVFHVPNLQVLGDIDAALGSAVAQFGRLSPGAADEFAVPRQPPLKRVFSSF